MKGIKGFWIIFIIIITTGTLEFVDSVVNIRTKYNLKEYKQACFNDSIPAYNRIISSRLTMLEAREDSAYMVSTGSIAEYSIWTQRRGGYATRYLLKESFKTSHREPTLAGFEEWLKKVKL